jgi:uncharacterized protein YbjT (DUF2867 family)
MRLLFAGATGLVGGHLLKLLGRHDVTLVGRRQAETEHEQLIGPPEKWADLVAGREFDVAISTLGTTIRQAGSQAAFAAIDRDAVEMLARAARNAGAGQFLLVSSVGASYRATNFYLRTKGEAEEAVRGLGFDRVDIFRPGLLTGERQGPVRPVERIMIALSPLTDLLTPAVLDQYRSIPARSVAAALAGAIGQAKRGTHVHHNREMLRDGGTIG